MTRVCPALVLLMACAAPVVAAPPPKVASAVAQWDRFEITLPGPSGGNPFVDVQLSAVFSQGKRSVTVKGFYDDNGTYRLRFMPDAQGLWRYVTRSNVSELDNQSGSFKAVAPRKGNQGLVGVKDKFNFAYASGATYVPVGTTIYAMVHQEDSLLEKTIDSLAKAPFNKVRFCVFPKWYQYNVVEPPRPPFVPDGKGRFDYTRPSAAFYQHLEKQIDRLAALGIEVDLILFHPYDENHWGFDRMGRDNDERYLSYLLARLSSFHNVWWSMANEWDFVKTRTLPEWNRLFDIVAAEDPYRHLASVHNGTKFFDHHRAPISHASVQHTDVRRIYAWRNEYGKPVIDDECEYEGNIEAPWGNITAQELTHRFWVGFVSGGYVGHGETYLAPDDVLWWARGGELHGQSPARIAFLRKFIDQGGGFSPLKENWPFDRLPAARQGKAYVVYFGSHQPGLLTSFLTEQFAKDDPTLKTSAWRFEIVDTWNMTRTAIPGVHKGKFSVTLPGKPWLALVATPTK